MSRKTAVLFLLPFLAFLPACESQDDTPVPAEEKAPSANAPASSDLTTIPADQLDLIVALFNKGVALMDRHQPDRAVAAFEEVVRLAPNWTTGRLNLGIALLNLHQESAFARAESELKRVISADPDSCHAHFALGMLLIHQVRYDEARPHFEQVLAIDPNDADAHYQYAVLLESNDPASAREHFEAALAAMPHFESACYRLQRLLRRSGERDRAQELLLRFQTLKATGAGVGSGMKYGEMGRYASVIRAFDGTDPKMEMDARIDYTDVADGIGLQQVSGGHPGWPGSDQTPNKFGPGVAAADIDGDGDLDVFVASASPDDHSTVYRNDNGRFQVDQDSGVDGSGSVAGYFGDYDADGAPDLFLTCRGSNRLYQNDGEGRFTDVTESCGVAGGDFLSVAAAWADADHDADLDLYVANFVSADSDGEQPTSSPNALWRNNGDGTFTNVAAAAGVQCSDDRSAGVVFFDVDVDRDLDILVLNHHTKNRIFQNDRAGEYVEVTSQFDVLADAGTGLGAVQGDVDTNGLEDLLLLRGNESPRLVLQHERGRFADDPAFRQAAEAIGGAVGGLLSDLDLDGDLDVVLLASGEEGATSHCYLVNEGRGRFAAPRTFGTTLALPEVGGAIAADLGGNGDLDLLVARAGKRPESWRREKPSGRHWLEVVPRMTGDGNENRPKPAAVGLQVELKTGLRSQVASVVTSSGYLGGPPPRVFFGMGTHGKADYVRLVWPDAVLQSELEIAADQRWHVTKVERKPSSCPVLFCWDGQRFVFVTDILGVGGLGFFMAPGEYATPDPTEDIRIPPQTIAIQDGKYLLRITEPLEEVAYIDQLTLIAYDHPADWEIYPDERFAAEPPAPTGRPFAVARKILPISATDDHGRDVLASVLEIDRRYVEPPVDPRFVGYAVDHFVEFDFGDRLKDIDPADRLVLYLYGWVEYTYSHVNYAAWQAGRTMKSPSIEVPDDNGGWRTVVADAGYPAGLPRMMTLDVTAQSIRDRGRFRIRTNMEIFWDRVFLAEDVADNQIVPRVLSPVVAKLRPLGFPREYSPDGANPTLYDYHRLDQGVAFKSLTGNYTRFGDVRSLVRETDDRFVIMGRGDEITLEFSAADLPPLPAGWSRTLVLHTDGYCKDMDLYTAFPDTVEPLPFHEMDNYPPKSRSPHGPAYDQYRRAWNTRRVLGR